MAGAFLVVVAMLVAHARSDRGDRPPRRRVRIRRRPSTGWSGLVGYVVGTAVGGYLLFVGIVMTFYLALGDQDSRFILQAIREGSVLTFGMVVPTFVLLSWIHERLWGRTER